MRDSRDVYHCPVLFSRSTDFSAPLRLFANFGVRVYVSVVAGGSVIANRLVHQGLAAVCLIASARLHERRGRPLAVPFLVMNPMCLAIVNGGHIRWLLEQ